MAKNIQRGRLIGLHVYTDERGRDIFYNVFDKKAYWINDNNDYKKFSVFQSRLPLAIALGFLVSVFTDMVWLGLVVGVATFVVMAVYFYVKFIPTLQVINSFKRPKTSYLMRVVEPLSDGRIIAASVLFIAIGVLLVVNAKINVDYSEAVIILNYVVAVLAVAMGIMFLVAFFIKKKSR